MRKKTAKYAWDKKSDSELQLWPETSTERYITRPFVNARVLGGKSGKQPLFSWPEFLGIDPLERYAILSAARTKHLSDYYQSRAGADFHLVLYTVGGGAELSYESGKSPLTANTFAFVPAGCPYELRSLRSGWEVVWFHLRPRGRRGKFDNIRVDSSENCEKISGIFKIYESEIYSKKPSIQILEPLAEALFLIISRDISPAFKKSGEDFLDAKIAKVKITLHKNWTIASASKFFGLPPRKLDELFKRKFSDTFSKTLLFWRMQEARRLLSTDATPLEKVAAKTGYADAFCLSKAFKRYFGKSPKAK